MLTVPPHSAQRQRLARMPSGVCREYVSCPCMYSRTDTSPATEPLSSPPCQRTPCRSPCRCNPSDAATACHRSRPGSASARTALPLVSGAPPAAPTVALRPRELSSRHAQRFSQPRPSPAVYRRGFLAYQRGRRAHERGSRTRDRAGWQRICWGEPLAGTSAMANAWIAEDAGCSAQELQGRADAAHAVRRRWQGHRGGGREASRGVPAAGTGPQGRGRTQVVCQANWQKVRGESPPI